ncbi:hypothetical protein ZIOFF_031824 [Zingiber officinale]|uniref:HAT C-terminal dimerisation domain-containing protein n=1 Tax=Zingiber officinale TaxID=94328 RepID=A0A8J5GLY6_ZINOF|nr:hypothetical protein ZIOFF_031824 [Zingiber officinale]
MSHRQLQLSSLYFPLFLKFPLPPLSVDLSPLCVNPSIGSPSSRLLPQPMTTNPNINDTGDDPTALTFARAGRGHDKYNEDHDQPPFSLPSQISPSSPPSMQQPISSESSDQAWMKYINLDVASISRNTLVSDINRIYLKEKEKLKCILTTEMMAYKSQTITSAGKSQLDLYLEELKLEFPYYQDLDILEHWKNQKHRYPTLALMACDVLAIPITTVASESAFSIGACVLTKYRSCTLHEKVQALICT